VTAVGDSAPLHNNGGITKAKWLILEYGYMGNMGINQDNVCPLLVSADYLSVPDLLELCRDFLRSTLAIENRIGIMRFAREYFPSLEGVARCLVTGNFVQVSQQTDELLELPTEELQAMIGADELNAKSEDIVWEGVLR
jgi:kelch-like protein 10